MCLTDEWDKLGSNYAYTYTRNLYTKVPQKQWVPAPSAKSFIDHTTGYTQR